MTRSRSLHFVRDDKGEGGASVKHSLLVEELQIPPLRFASVVDKEGAVAHLSIGC
jgi:hypothetical protein